MLEMQTLKEIRREHPAFFRAVAADARTTLAYRAEPFEFISKTQLLLQVLRLSWVSDAFFAQLLYRAKARLQYFRIPIVPTILHRFAMMHSQVCIGSPVVIEPGIYIAHGQVVIDGFVKIASGVVLLPWVTVGLKAGIIQGPRIGNGVQIGTGAKIIGPITVGPGAVIGANSVVVSDVDAGQTVGGIPARPLR
jgi:serine O-acetyltransferase